MTLQEWQTAECRTYSEISFDEVLNRPRYALTSSSHHYDVGDKTLDHNGSMEVKHIIMPRNLQTLVQRGLTRIHHKSSNQILQMGIIEGFYLYSVLVRPRVVTNSREISERILAGDMVFAESLEDCSCNFPVDGVAIKKSRMSVTLDKQDAEIIGSVADEICIDRQMFHLVLFLYALRTHPGIDKQWRDICESHIRKFEDRFDDRMKHIKMKLDKPTS